MYAYKITRKSPCDKPCPRIFKTGDCTGTPSNGGVSRMPLDAGPAPEAPDKVEHTRYQRRSVRLASCATASVDIDAHAAQQASLIYCFWLLPGSH